MFIYYFKEFKRISHIFSFASFNKPECGCDYVHVGWKTAIKNINMKHDLSSISHVSQLCPTLCNPRTEAHQATLSMEFS